MHYHLWNWYVWLYLYWHLLATPGFLQQLLHYCFHPVFHSDSFILNCFHFTRFLWYSFLSELDSHLIFHNYRLCLFMTKLSLYNCLSMKFFASCFLFRYEYQWMQVFPRYLFLSFVSVYIFKKSCNCNIVWSLISIWFIKSSSIWMESSKDCLW